MKFYSFHIGDYRKHTGHLTPPEHYIYRFLIDEYYQDEMPLTLDTVRLTRKLCLQTEDIPAVVCILQEFFIETDEGWQHHRIDEDLDRYALAKANKRKAGMASGKARRTYQKNRTGVQSCSTEDEQEGTSVEQNVDSVELPITHYPLPSDVQKRTSSADLSGQHRTTGKVICLIPTNKFSANGQTYGVQQDQADEWHKAYPDIDIDQQLKRIRSWNVANPTKRKTHKGMTRHITAWLLNKQEEGESNAKGITTGNKSAGTETKSEKFWNRTKSNIKGTG